MTKYHKYTEEEAAYLQSLSSLVLTRVQVAEKFNEHFGTSLSVDSINRWAKSHGIKLTYTLMEYSDDEIALMKKLRPSTECKELADILTKTFSIKRTESGIQRKCIELGLTGPTDGKYKNGHKVWCQDMNYDEFRSHYTNETWENYKKKPEGYNKKFNVGDISTKLGSANSDKRYYYMKVSSDKNLPKREQWKPLQRIVWEQHYGPIPKDHIIIFLDGDSMNCDISNLACVDKATGMSMSKNRLYSVEPIITKVGIRICEIEKLVKEANNGIR